MAHVTRRALQARDLRPRNCEPNCRPAAPGLLSEAESKQILAGLGIEIPRGGLAESLADAIRIADEIGYPVVLKAQSADLPHKSDVGGVQLGISSPEELADAWSTLHRKLQRARPDLVLDGVLVERMARKGIELIVGARNDPQWGPVLMVGSGGVLAEAMNDVLLLPPDLSPDQKLSKR